MPPGKRRRVTFADEPSVVTFEKSTDQSEVGEDDFSEEKAPGTRAIQGRLLADRPAASSDDKAAGHSRPATDLHDMQGIEDTSILEDLAEAEEEYDRPEQAFNEAGVAFEPFHLKQEREEGYFDPDGNYIQYKLDEVKDAWLDSLADGATSSIGSAAAMASGQAGKQPQESAQAVELDADELHTYKRRLVDLLQPQETVLAALRRLGGLHGTTHVGSDALPWKRARKAADHTSWEHTQSLEKKPTVRCKSSAGSSSSSITNRSAAPGLASSASSPSMRMGRTVPVENREAFDRLTEYSSLLLQHGDYGIHSTPREHLLAQTDAAMAAQLQAVMGVLSTSCSSSASEASVQTSDMRNRNASFNGSAPLFAPHGATAMPGSEEVQASHGMDTNAAAPSAAALAGSNVTQDTANEAAVEQPFPADPDEDIFGGAEAQQQHLPIVHGSMTQAFNQDGDEAEASSDARQGDKLLNEMAIAVSSMPASKSTGSASGFVYDDSSGTWFNADLGYFYDTTQGLYGDAASGKWYSYVDGMYQLVC